MAPWGKLPFTQDWVFAIKTWWNMHISGLSGKSWKHPWNKWTLFMWAMSLAVSWASVESALCLQRSLNFQQFLSKCSNNGNPLPREGFKKNIPQRIPCRCLVTPLEQGTRSSSLVTDQKDLVWATDWHTLQWRENGHAGKEQKAIQLFLNVSKKRLYGMRNKLWGFYMMYFLSSQQSVLGLGKIVRNCKHSEDSNKEGWTGGRHTNPKEHGAGLL